MAKIFLYRGKTLAELQKMTLQEFSKLVPSNERRRITRGLSAYEKKFVSDVLAAARAGNKNTIRTHCRDVIITPQMIGSIVAVHTGKEFVTMELTEHMVGHRLGEFALTRKRTQHGAPGMGATKSSMFVPLK